MKAWPWKWQGWLGTREADLMQRCLFLALCFGFGARLTGLLTQLERSYVTEYLLPTSWPSPCLHMDNLDAAGQHPSLSSSTGTGVGLPKETMQTGGQECC